MPFLAIVTMLCLLVAMWYAIITVYRHGDCKKEHKWKLKSSSDTFDYYECSRIGCNHSKGHHKK